MKVTLVMTDLHYRLLTWANLLPKIYCRFEHQHIDFPCIELHITKAMPRWPRALDAEDRLQAALTI
jgi:hypothetical protein